MVPSSRPRAADGTDSSSFSVNSWAAADRWVTPSAASSAFSARRCRTLAAIETQKPVIASSAAAAAMASSACCGAADSGSPAVAAPSAAALVTDAPGGSAAVSAAGT